MHLSWICLWTSTSLFWASFAFYILRYFFMIHTLVYVCAGVCMWVCVYVSCAYTFCVFATIYMVRSASVSLSISRFITIFTHTGEGVVRSQLKYGDESGTHTNAHTHTDTHTHTPYQHTNPASKWMICILSNACFKCLCTSIIEVGQTVYRSLYVCKYVCAWSSSTWSCVCVKFGCLDVAMPSFAEWYEFQIWKFYAILCIWDEVQFY